MPRSATLSILSDNGHKKSFPCRFASLSNQDVIVQAELRIGPNQSVSIEQEDLLFLGEVVQCLVREDLYLHRVRVTERLTNLQGMLRLRDTLFGSESANENRNGIALVAK